MCVTKFFFGAALFGIVTWLFIWWLGFNYHGKAKLGLKTFRQIYLVNPSRWRYGTSHYYDDFRHLHYRENYYSDGDRVKLSFIAFLWFLYRHITQKYRAKKEAEREYLISILECCQRDIDRIKRDSEKQIESALQEQKRILRNWK